MRGRLVERRGWRTPASRRSEGARGWEWGEGRGGRRGRREWIEWIEWSEWSEAERRAGGRKRARDGGREGRDGRGGKGGMRKVVEDKGDREGRQVVEWVGSESVDGESGEWWAHFARCLSRALARLEVVEV